MWFKLLTLSAKPISLFSMSNKTLCCLITLDPRILLSLSAPRARGNDNSLPVSGFSLISVMEVKLQVCHDDDDHVDCAYQRRDCKIRVCLMYCLAIPSFIWRSIVGQF